MRKYWYIAVFLSLVAAAGVLLAVAIRTDEKPDKFKLALVYSSDTWGDLFPCG